MFLGSSHIKVQFFIKVGEYLHRKMLDTIQQPRRASCGADEETKKAKHHLSYKKRVIVHPSSMVTNRLTVTWWFGYKILKNSFSLDQSLFIGDEKLEDVDKIFAFH